MNLDLSIASLVRASSGVLMAGFGLYLLTVRPASVRSQALGTYLLAHGPVFVGTNLLRFDISAIALWFRLTVPLFLVAGGALVVLTRHASRDDLRLRIAFVMTFALLFAANFAAAVIIPSDLASAWGTADATMEARVALNRAYDEGRLAYGVVYAAVPAAAIAFAVLFRSASDPLERRRLASLAAALSVYPVFDQTSSLLLDAGSRATALIVVPAFALAVIAWALAARGPASAAARNTSLAIVFSGLVGMGTAVLGDDYGLIGAARLAGLAILAYAIFRLDLLGTGFTARTIRRGTVATAGLASLFIVAQIAQEFFAAEYGLLIGGMVAGTLLFAAHPIQRAMERLTEGRTIEPSPPARVEPAGGAARREEVYLNAVRLALRDRRLTRAEELHLTRLAEELGIGAGRAHELLVKAEEEAEVA